MGSSTSWWVPFQSAANWPASAATRKGWACSNMSNSALFVPTTVPCRSLAEYVMLLLSRLQSADERAAARIRDAVGDRSACIVLDDERINVRVEGTQVVASSTVTAGEDGRGVTSRTTTLDL